MNGAQLIVTLLKKNEVDIIFGYPGGAIMPIYDALFDGGIEHLLCRHEQGAVFAAIGYARATGKVGVCCATSGPGATNLITGLADALLDSVPIIAITGQVGLNFIGTDAFQEIDVLGLSLACTKHSFLVESLCVLPHIINTAFIIASSDRPGPVLVDIPKDIQLLTAGSVISDSLNVEDNVVVSSHNVKIASNLEIAHLLISQSRRPVLYVGGGVGISGAVSKLRDFIRITGIPVVATLKGLGSPDYNDPCYLGMLGMHGNKAANLVVQKCDLLIAVGARFDDRVTGQVSSFAPKAKVIHLDIDASEFNKLRHADVILLGDLSYSLTALSQSLSLDHWREEVQNLRNKYRWYYNNTSNQTIYAPMLLKKINDSAPSNSVITTDVGQHQMWVAQHMQFDSPKNFISSSGLGSMGFGVPAAIGAQIGRPQSTVVCISGDGSFMMNVQELGTIKRKKLPIKIVLLDNQRLGMVRQWQELFFNQRYCETSLIDNPNFIMLAQSFNIDALSICCKNQITHAIARLFAHSGPFLLHVIISEFANVWPLVPPGASNDIMLDGAIMI